MAIKKTLLEIVQSILSDMDSAEVNSISDSVEAEQIASIVENVFYQTIATRKIPEHNQLLKMTAASDSAFPTHFNYPDNVKHISWLTYDKSTDGSYEYGDVNFVEPDIFLSRTDTITSNFDNVVDKSAGTNLRIRNDRMPSFYTTFDDYYLVLDAYDSDIDTTLQESKTRAYGVKYPVFDRTDDAYVPDLDATFFPLLIAESTSMAQSLLKGGSDPKVEQAARRQKSYIQNDLYRTVRENKRPLYGRK